MFEPSKSTVSVLIYGQEYTISGDMPREEIMKIADYVDSKMNEIGDVANLPTSQVAILSAINITEELFDAKKDGEDAIKYAQLWEETKIGYSKLREEVAMINEQKEELIRQNGEKDNQLGSLYQQLSDEKRHNETLRQRVEELTVANENAVAAPEAANQHIEELEAKCRDIESSFFDIQMENIRLKNEIDMLRRQR